MYAGVCVCVCVCKHSRESLKDDHSEVSRGGHDLESCSPH